MNLKFKLKTTFFQIAFVFLSIFYAFSNSATPQLQNSSALTPAIREEGNSIILENNHAKLIVSNTGQLAALIDKSTGTDYLDHTYPISFMSVRKGTVEFDASKVSREGERFTVQFGGSGINAIIRIGVHRGYFTTEVLEVNQQNFDELVLFDMPLTISERVGTVINICRNDHFGVCLMSGNVPTESRTIKTAPAEFKSSCYPQYGVVGAKAILITGPSEKILQIIGEMEIEQGMSHPILGGEWGKISKEVKKSYFFVDFTEQNIDRVIELAKEGGFGYLVNYDGTWSSACGKYAVNMKNFPHGLEGVKATMDKAHAAGLKCGAHMLSGCISMNDGYVTPVPDPRMAKDDMRTLQENITENTVDIPITTSPEGLPLEDNYMSRGMNLVIDQEVIRYQGVKKDAPFALTNCVRGAYGTKAAPHAKGAKIYHLTQFYGMFLVGGNSDMVEEVARNVARIINYCGFDMIYFDGSEAMENNGSFYYYVGKMLSETFKGFNREVIAQGSSMPHINWHNYSRRYTIDFSILDQKGLVDHHCTQFEEARNNFMPVDLGWHGYFLDSPNSESTMPDDIEYVLAKTVGWDCAWSLETQMGAVENHGRTAEILALSKVYEELRLNNYFSERVKSILRTPKQDFKLMKDENGNWQMHPMRYGPAVLTPCKDGENIALNVTNEYKSQPFKVRLKTRPAPADFGDSENIVLTDFVDLSQWKGESANPGFALKIDRSTEQIKIDSGSLKITAKNDSNGRSSWASQTLPLSKPLDLTTNRALGVWVYGDGNGGLLSIRLRDEGTVFCRDHFIRLNFKGWKYCEISEPARMEIYDYQWPGWPLLSVRSVNYRKISALSIFLNDVPPNTAVAIYLSSVEALRERPTTLQNPSFTVNGNLISIPAMLENNHYLEFWGSDEATVFDENGHLISKVKPVGSIPVVTTGANNVVFRCEGSPSSRKQCRVEMITIGDAITK